MYEDGHFPSTGTNGTWIRTAMTSGAQRKANSARSLMMLDVKHLAQVETTLYDRGPNFDHHGGEASVSLGSYLVIKNYSKVSYAPNPRDCQ
ncbi:hypothetical protein NEOLI_004074 [Neolecta irregularis DAH-3]|uniref:Uncharacterized protein n=1 Tax=Neolecta irregularis (strain DAH-3) TaxID=1198029 RepID=A0A1U7LL30_NEOID|nr:hypothetical protein NEOLI_004074 [Neolecta irregularis DAH-3]|eukprot:OLL23349.1 hypothetical protein NEOLI_004074 [Neolecta irregularis DAH-3]